jgi:hypothetical protein
MSDQLRVRPLPREVLGLDVGGANLKGAHTCGSACLRPFELWKSPERLPQALAEFLHQLPAFDLLAVTMTGELCDCFATRRQGVQAILDAVEGAAGPRPVRVWRTDGRLAEVAAARATPVQTAAANWLALAVYAGRLAPSGAAVVVDIGSTTTDIVPLMGGKPVPCGLTDVARLRSRELVYTGARRTPLMALLGPGVAAELFATTLDVYLLLGNLAEDPADRATADGRPATQAAAHARLARLVCSDSETCSLEETRRLAQRARDRQLRLIATAMARVAGGLPQRPRTWILAGSGEFLAQAALARQKGWGTFEVISLAERLGPGISQCACAYALAVLASEGTCDGS